MKKFNLLDIFVYPVGLLLISILLGLGLVCDIFTKIVAFVIGIPFVIGFLLIALIVKVRKIPRIIKDIYKTGGDWSFKENNYCFTSLMYNYLFNYD